MRIGNRTQRWSLAVVQAKGGRRGAWMRSKRQHQCRGRKYNDDRFGGEEMKVRVFLGLIPCKTVECCLLFLNTGK